MKTFDQYHKDCGSCCYWGDRGTWLLCITRTRDSDSLELSNFEVMHQTLTSQDTPGKLDKHVAIERENHWLCGWVEHVLLDPSNAKLVDIAEKMQKQLEAYPVLDEMHWSNLECQQYEDYAESELKHFGEYFDVLRACEIELNLEIGSQCSETEVIEAARSKLETLRGN